MSEKHPEAKLLDLIRRSGRDAVVPNRGPGSFVTSLRGAASRAQVFLSDSDPMRAAILVLVTALAASMGLLVAGFPRGDAFPSKPVPGSPTPSRHAPESREADASRILRKVASRDLFRTSVQAMRGPVTAAPKPEPSAAGLKILGFLGEGPSRQAIVMDSRNGETSYLEKGGAVREFLVEEVGSGRVVLSHSGRIVTLNF